MKREARNRRFKAMRTEKSLAASRSLVDRELERILSGDDSLLYQAMRYTVLSGGKRFRPILLLSSAACFGVLPKVSLPFACALELIHNSSLIHDDLPAMDNDDFRRGMLSCHRAYGEDIAVLAGDALLILAFETMAEAPVPAGLLLQKQEAIVIISRKAGAPGMIGGQVLDITLKPGELTEAALEDLILKKTGALIVAAAETGAVLGKARRKERELISDFGKCVGLAFQVRDDILDSRQSRRRKGPERPDTVSFFGMVKAKKKLEEFVQKAEAALLESSLEAEDLLCLARSLLNLKIEGSHG